MDHLALELKLARGEKRAEAMRRALMGPKISAKGRHILARALGKQLAANLYRQKLAALTSE
jgi:hypothetical protein